MPLIGTNLLQEEEDEFPTEKPPWQPPLRRMGRQDERLLSEPSFLSSNGGDNLLQSRTTSIQEREDDEDITSSSYKLRRGGGPAWASNSSFSWWRPSPTKVGAYLGFQDQSALNWSPRTHPDSVFDDLHMVGKLI